MEFFSFLMESINQGKLKQNDIEEYGTYLTWWKNLWRRMKKKIIDKELIIKYLSDQGGDSQFMLINSFFISPFMNRRKYSEHLSYDKFFSSSFFW